MAINKPLTPKPELNIKSDFKTLTMQKTVVIGLDSNLNQKGSGVSDSCKKYASRT